MQEKSRRAGRSRAHKRLPENVVLLLRRSRRTTFPLTPGWSKKKIWAARRPPEEVFCQLFSCSTWGIESRNVVDAVLRSCATIVDGDTVKFILPLTLLVVVFYIALAWDFLFRINSKQTPYRICSYPNDNLLEWSAYVVQSFVWRYILVAVGREFLSGMFGHEFPARLDTIEVEISALVEGNMKIWKWEIVRGACMAKLKQTNWKHRVLMKVTKEITTTPVRRSRVSGAILLRVGAQDFSSCRARN